MQTKNILTVKNQIREVFLLKSKQNINLLGNLWEKFISNFLLKTEAHIFGEAEGTAQFIRKFLGKKISGSILLI